MNRFLQRFMRLRDEAGDGGDGGAGDGGNILAGANGGDNAGDGGSGGDAAAQAAAAGGNAEPFAMNIYDEEGNVSEAFKASVPEEHKGFLKHVSKYKTTEDYIKGTSNLLYMAKRGEIAPVPEDAPEGVKAEYAAKVKSLLGIPGTADAYRLPDGIDEANVDKEFVAQLQQFSHEHNVTPEAFQKFAPILMEREAAIHATYQQAEDTAVQEGRAALAKEYGDETQKNFQLATNAAIKVDPTIDVANDPAFNHATTVRLAVALAKATGDDAGLQNPSSAAGANGMTAAEQSADIIKNPNNPQHAAYHDPKHANHKAAVAEQQRLSKLATRK